MRKRGVLIWFLTVILIIGFFLIPSPVSRIAKNFLLKNSGGPASSLINFGHQLSNSFSVIFEISKLRKENQRLTIELVESKVDSSKFAEFEIENKNLKEQLDFKEAHPEMKLLIANVIGLDPTNFYDSVLVNRGSNDGVSSGMAVIYLGGLVGKTDQVGENSSTVILITSKNSIAQIMLEGSRTTGVLKGGISGMTLENIPLDTVINADENVVTSGLGGKLPKNIFVGNAGQEISVKSDIFKTVEVKSPINFRKLETLFIVTGV